MMRLAWIILALAVLAGGVVHLRRLQADQHARLNRLAGEREVLRRTIQDLQLQHDQLSGPAPAAWRAQAWPLPIVAPDEVAPADQTIAHSEP